MVGYYYLDMIPRYIVHINMFHFWKRRTQVVQSSATCIISPEDIQLRWNPQDCRHFKIPDIWTGQYKSPIFFWYVMLIKENIKKSLGVVLLRDGTDRDGTDRKWPSKPFLSKKVGWPCSVQGVNSIYRLLLFLFHLFSLTLSLLLCFIIGDRE